ncbi:MAG: gamma-glutamyl-gamma-aminobutyrate hydrolase family protein [Firmicutes bacterium]|nr:gamma-glutamyl-gamma-aminobutyrate hydrolase family protein [Bacillota bacterium]
MKQPIIGITCFVDFKEERQRQNETYIQAVLKAGGVPVLLPAVDSEDITKEHAQLIDGLLVSGGPDMDPQYFGEQPVPELGNVNPLMDIYESRLVQLILDLDKPLLGICRGEQVLNVVAGGTLHQDLRRALPQVLKHGQDQPRWYPSHTVRIAPGTKLAAIFETEELAVNSFHHQAVAKVAPGFIASAHAQDGVIEAIESQSHRFVIGVLWHPEGMWNQVKNYDSLFAAFVQAAREGR